MSDPISNTTTFDPSMVGMQAQRHALAQANNEMTAAKGAHGAHKKIDGKHLRDVAQNFEAVFLGEMLRPMFDNLEPEGPFGGGPGEEVWKNMQIDEFGKAIAKNGGIGLADHIVRAMLQMQEKKQ